MENGKYVTAAREYRRLLKKAMEQGEGENPADPVAAGAVWHNLGTAYARLFLFEKAADCYRHAYALNGNPKSMKECLAACRCLGDEQEFKRKASAVRLSGEELQELEEELSRAGSSAQIQDLQKELEDAFLTKEPGMAKVTELLEEWREEYRRNCKV